MTKQLGEIEMELKNPGIDLNLHFCYLFCYARFGLKECDIHSLRSCEGILHRRCIYALKA